MGSGGVAARILDTSALDGGEWSGPPPPGTYWIGGWKFLNVF